MKSFKRFKNITSQSALSNSRNNGSKTFRNLEIPFRNGSKKLAHYIATLFTKKS